MSVDAHRFVGRGATIDDMPPTGNDVRGNERRAEILAGPLAGSRGRSRLPKVPNLKKYTLTSVVYQVSVYDESSHHIRAAWVRLGTRIWGVMEPGAVDVIWDGTDQAAPP